MGKCRKCSALIVTRKVCAPGSAGPDAIEAGLELMQLTREHFRSEHPASVWMVAESVGQLAALFPFLAGVDVDAAQRSVLVLTYHALKAQLFSVGFEVGEGVFGTPDRADMGMVSGSVVDPLILAGRVEVLEELIAAGVGGLVPKLEQERAALRFSIESGGGGLVVAS